MCAEDDIITVMDKNWNKVCLTLLPNCEELTLSDERKVLQIIEKNIYHKRQSMTPITLATVSYWGGIYLNKSAPKH